MYLPPPLRPPGKVGSGGPVEGNIFWGGNGEKALRLSPRGPVLVLQAYPFTQQGSAPYSAHFPPCTTETTRRVRLSDMAV